MELQPVDGVVDYRPYAGFNDRDALVILLSPGEYNNLPVLDLDAGVDDDDVIHLVVFDLRKRTVADLYWVGIVADLAPLLVFLMRCAGQF